MALFMLGYDIPEGGLILKQMAEPFENIDAY
jgi:hypothetical protein